MSEQIKHQIEKEAEKYATKATLIGSGIEYQKYRDFIAGASTRIPYQLENERLKKALGECRDLFFYMEGNDFNDFKLSVSEQLKKTQKLLFEINNALNQTKGK